MSALRTPNWRRICRWACCVALFAVIVSVAGDALACPTCKDGVAEADPSQQRMAAGYYYSILFMMSMPFVILSTFGSFAYRAVRKARIEQEVGAEG